MKILITGSSGQLGKTLVKTIPEFFKKEEHEIVGLTRKDFDLLDLKSCEKILKEFRPDWLINTAAYTNVEKAEKEPLLAKSVNTIAPEFFAKILSYQGGKMLHLSTDFVFSCNQGKPYRTEQKMSPKCIYGITKCDGEKAVRRYLPAFGFVLRTSWLYAGFGKNFLLTMLKLQREYAFQNKSIKVVSDQVGCPTSVSSLASTCWEIVIQGEANIPKILHWSDSGAASWYDFAIAIRDTALDKGLIKEKVDIQPIKASEYNSTVERPYYSLLDCSITEKSLRLKSQHWQKCLSKTLCEINK